MSDVTGAGEVKPTTKMLKSNLNTVRKPIQIRKNRYTKSTQELNAETI